jgi:dihydroflavonol-4-reductase
VFNGNSNGNNELQEDQAMAIEDVDTRKNVEIKRALVTGAGGFIGSHVVRELQARGVEVRALLRPGEPRDNLEGLAELELLEGDLLDPAAVDAAMAGVDTLFHLAAIYAIWMEDWSRIYEVNMQGARNVLWSALRHDVRRVVYTSSIAAIGVAPGRQLSDETTPFNQYTLGHHYVLTKYLSQQEALGFAQNGLDLVVVNPAFPFGERDLAPTPTGQIIIDILRGHNRFYFAGGVNIVDVQDVARGHVLAAERGRAGELYILGNANVTLEELTRLVCRVAGLERALFRLPVPVLRAAATGLSWVADRVTHRPPLTTPREVAYSSQHLFYDVGKARRELGLQPAPVEASLERAIRWFRRAGMA